MLQILGCVATFWERLILRFQYMLELANTYPTLSKCGQGSQIKTPLPSSFGRRGLLSSIFLPDQLA